MVWKATIDGEILLVCEKKWEIHTIVFAVVVKKDGVIIGHCSQKKFFIVFNVYKVRWFNYQPSQW